jgi:immune inhibitor A
VFSGNVPGVGGYFSAEDLYPRVVNPYSNQKKIIYINLGAEEPGTSSYNSVMAHEFQHMIHFHEHPADEAWINEGSSMLAQVLNGYTADGLDQDKADSPDTQLDSFDYANFGPYYGGGYLWLLYLYEQFGGTRVTRAILSDSSLSNMALFDDVLARLHTGLTSTQVFANWLVANFLNDKTVAGGIYGYTHSTIHSSIQPPDPVSLPFTRTPTMHQYAANYVDIGQTNGKAFTLTFAGKPTVPLLGTTAPAQGFWWSNRGDSVDTALTLPPLDLRHVSHATLHYSLWYDLEQDYDYGYVEVSTDGGATWYAQRTAHTTTTNPNGANIGDGYTGSSCSPSSKAENCWVPETLDLSPYAGKQILVRFEQVTDDEVNKQGIAVAHVQVPEIGFHGDTTASGWKAAGWLRAGNTLAEQWVVQAIVYRPGGIKVVPMQVGADGTGTLAIPAGSTRVVVVVSPVAPLTTVTNTYMLSGGS